MRLKNSIDYKRFPEPSRGDWTGCTILVLSALCNQQKVPHERAAFFVWARAGESSLSNRSGPKRKEASGLTFLLIAPGQSEKCEAARGRANLVTLAILAYKDAFLPKSNSKYQIETLKHPG